MTTEPVLDKQRLAKAIVAEYGIPVQAIEFLPIGADVRSFSYKCLVADGIEFFLKLRLPNPNQALHLPTAVFVMNQVKNAIQPIANRTNSQYWMAFDSYQAILFPYISGVSGWGYTLSADQWREVGRSMRSLHDLVLPESMAQAVPRETYTGCWRERAIEYLTADGTAWSTDSSAKNLMDVLRQKKTVLMDIIDHAEALAATLRRQPLDLACCHGDWHSGNFLIDGLGKVHPIDWDTLSLAPKEKDLMFIGGGVGGMLDAKLGTTPFYEGYGTVELNQDAMRYFRFERIIQDVVAYCEQLLASSEGGEDRPVMLGQFARQFEQGGVIDIAYQ